MGRIVTMDEKSASLKKLNDFLLHYKVKKGESYTITSICSPSGSYYIPDQKISKFYKIYNKAIENGNVPHLTEKHKDKSPILIDIDMRLPLDEVNRCYTEKHILAILDLYSKQMDKYLDLKINSEAYIFFVMQRDKPYQDKDKTKDGLHIICPYIQTIP